MLNFSNCFYSSKNQTTTHVANLRLYEFKNFQIYDIIFFKVKFNNSTFQRKIHRGKNGYRN